MTHAAQDEAPLRELVATRVETLPPLDQPNHEAWRNATPRTTRDELAGIDIVLRALHDGQRVSIRADFDDPDENRLHRRLVWDETKGVYVDGPEREDVLTIKWNMSSHESGLTLAEDTPYVADIWFWKARRTDHAGYADDKLHTFTTTPERGAKSMLSKDGATFYLLRKGDAGSPAYHTLLHPGFVGERADKFFFTPPEGSRADVRAKGTWREGRWTVIFQRALQTGHDDDVAMTLDGAHRFGVSRFEIAGREQDPTTHEPRFGSGDVGELFLLTFQ